MKINPGAPTAVVAPAAAKPVAAAEVPLSKEGVNQLEKFVNQIHAAVDVQAAALKAKNKPVPPALAEKKHAADELLTAARSGRSLSAAEVATQLNALLWELTPTQLTALRDGLQEQAKDFGELAKLQTRLIPGLPATLGSVVNLISGAAKVPTSVKEVDRMLGDVAAALQKHPENAEHLDAQRTALEGMRARLEQGEAIVAPMSLPTSQTGAHSAVAKLTEQLGDLHGQLAALLGGKDPAQLSGDAKTKFDRLSAETVKVGADLKTLAAYSAQLDGYLEPTALDHTGFLVGISLGPAVDLAKWIPGFPVPVFGGVGAGLQLFERDKSTGERKLDWYAAANLQTPFGGGGYAISGAKRGFSAAFNPPLGSKMGISLATHPFHGRKLDVFIPGVFRAEATSTGALALTLFSPVPIPGLKVGLTVLVRNPVLANVTGPILYALDKGTKASVGAADQGKQAAKEFFANMFGPTPASPVPA